MSSYANEWLSFLARWLHVIAGIVWIGTSFYFVALDNHLRDDESWEIHGGGFYRVQKFTPAPPRLPDVLHWLGIRRIHRARSADHHRPLPAVR